MSLAAQEALEGGAGENPLLDAIADDPAFGLSRQDLDGLVDPQAFTGRSARQVEEFLSEHLEPALEGVEAKGAEGPRV